MCRAIALMWIGALVEPPIAEQATIAFSNAARVRISEGLRSSRTISTARRPGLTAAGHRDGAGQRRAGPPSGPTGIDKVAVKRRGWGLAGFLNWMHREFDRDAAGIANAGAHAWRKRKMMAIAWAQTGAGL